MSTITCHYGYLLDVAPGHACPPHAHLATEIVCNLGCTGVLHQDRRERSWRDGDAFVYQPDGLHSIRIARGGRQVCICVSGLGAERLPRGVHRMDARVVAAAQQVAGILGDAGAVQRAARLDLAAGELVLAMAACIAVRPEPVAPAQAAQALIDAHLGDDLAISEIAAQVHVTPDYLRQTFRRALGTSPQRYRIVRRIRLAQDLLARTELAVGEIAERVGIPDRFYFARLFRRVAGVTPTQWRARSRSPS